MQKPVSVTRYHQKALCLLVSNSVLFPRTGLSHIPLHFSNNVEVVCRPAAAPALRLNPQ